MKTRLDIEMTARFLAPSRAKAREAVSGGYVFLNGIIEKHPARLVDQSDIIEVDEKIFRYVSRGGFKLEHALKKFRIETAGKTAVDAGASTGGFTDCLLQHGAVVVYSVEAGVDQLAQKLRDDIRVKSYENTDIRHFIPPAKPQIVAADLSFIRLDEALPALYAIGSDTTDYIILVKPQFETKTKKAGKNGVVKKPEQHVDILSRVLLDVKNNNFTVKGITHSPIRGGDGNIEYLLYLMKNGDGIQPDVKKLVSDAFKSFKTGDD